MDLSLLFTVPEIPHKNSFCTVEYLTPLKYNISGTCYTGPITYDNLALVTCSNVKSLVQVDSLQKCFQQDRTLLCPHHIFQSVKNVAWLGFPWNPTTKLSFPRHHQPARDCSDLHPLHVLGGRYYLATTADTLQLNTGPINTSPLAVYHFPCNTTFNGMATGLGVWDTMEVNIPLFNPDHIRYILRKPTDDDHRQPSVTTAECRARQYHPHTRCFHINCERYLYLCGTCIQGLKHSRLTPSDTQVLPPFTSMLTKTSTTGDTSRPPSSGQQ